MWQRRSERERRRGRRQRERRRGRVRRKKSMNGLYRKKLGEKLGGNGTLGHGFEFRL